VLAAVGTLAALLQILRVGGGASFWAAFLFAILVGLEANSLRRWTLARSGRPAVDVVAASDLEEAETRAFARWLEGGASAGAAQPRAGVPIPYRRPEPVIGLFPEAERPR
jgi:hypothetical protein